MGKTIGELAEELRQKAGAREYEGHSYLDLMRFADETRHMVIFDVLTSCAAVGEKGHKMRLYLSDAGYDRALADERKGNIKIRSHARVKDGHLLYDHKERER